MFRLFAYRSLVWVNSEMISKAPLQRYHIALQDLPFKWRDPVNLYHSSFMQLYCGSYLEKKSHFTAVPSNTYQVRTTETFFDQESISTILSLNPWICGYLWGFMSSINPNVIQAWTVYK